MISASVLAAVLFAAMLHAAWNALLKSGKDPWWVAGWIALSTVMVAAPGLFFVRLDKHALPFLIASILVHILYFTLLTLAYQRADLSSAYPIARGSSPLLVTMGAWLFSSERPALVALIGVTLIVGGILLMGFEKGGVSRNGALLSLAVGVLIAAYTLLDGIGVRASRSSWDYNLYLFAAYGLGMLLIVVAKSGVRFLQGTPRQIGLAVGGGVGSVIGYAIVTWAMKAAPMGLVSALRETSVLFAAAIAVSFLREKLSIQRVIACFGVVLGAALIALGRK